MDHVLSSGSNVLITGATGLIGGEVLRRLDAFTRGRVWALVRPLDGADPAERLEARYRRSGCPAGPGPNVAAVAGDVTAPGWGLAPDDLARVTGAVDVIVHSAADTSFAAHRDTGRTNVESVRRLIELARRCGRRPLVVYVGTAANVGRAARRCLAEDDGCQLANEHFNEYTRSKAVAEALLRDSGLPVLVLRPTIVLGADLSDPDFAKQILWCVPLTRCFRGLPIDPAARLDIVDVGFVADATLELLRRPGRRWDCYHLSAGPATATTVGQLGTVVDRLYRRKRPVELIPAEAWNFARHREFVRTPLQRRVFRSLRHYLPFFNMDVVYDDARLRADLGDRRPPVRPPAEYLPELLRLIRPRAALREAALP
jgi:nucleoside-diphosphate-sugar epimerase